MEYIEVTTLENLPIDKQATIDIQSVLSFHSIL